MLMLKYLCAATQGLLLPLPCLSYRKGQALRLPEQCGGSHDDRLAGGIMIATTPQSTRITVWLFLQYRGRSDDPILFPSGHRSVDRVRGRSYYVVSTSSIQPEKPQIVGSIADATQN